MKNSKNANPPLVCKKTGKNPPFASLGLLSARMSKSNVEIIGGSHSSIGTDSPCDKFV